MILPSDERHERSRIPRTERAAAPSLRELVTQLGWKTHEREDDSLLIDLEVPWGFLQATLEGTVESGARVFAEVSPLRASPSTREALAEFLGIADASIRYVRSTLEEEVASLRASFEARVDPEVEIEELARAVEAVSVACSVFGREIRALEDEALAREYVAARRTDSPPTAQRAGGLHGQD